MTVHSSTDMQRNSSPFGRGWIPASRDIGLPGEYEERESAGEGREEPGFAAYVPRPFNLPHSAFHPERRIRFLDALAGNGNVRAACMEVGISPQAAYTARRRDACFAAGWEAALLLAREHAEAVLADRALNGVEEVVFHRGEMVGRRVKFDNRLLLALLGRLDRRCENERAQAAAERFDEILAAIGGLRPEEGLAAAASMDAQEMGLAASREDYRDWTMERAIEEAEAAGLDAVDPGEMQDAAWERADAVFDAWKARVEAAVDELLEEEGEGEGAEPMPTPDPSRMREGNGMAFGASVSSVPQAGSSRLGAATGGRDRSASLPQDSVNCVNLTPGEDEEYEIDWSRYPNLRFHP